MTAKTNWKRVTALALAVFVAHAPAAFAGSLLESALQAAAEVRAQPPVPERDAVSAGSSARPGAGARAAAAQAPAGRGDRGRMRARNVWALVGAGVAIGLIMMKLDRAVEDSTPSTRRERRDGCGFFCS